MPANVMLDEATQSTSLDLLYHEDCRILMLGDRVAEKRGPSVEERSQYGDLAKLLIRHLALREAALNDVASVLRRLPETMAISDQFVGDPEPRRRQMGIVERMSRGVQGISLNTGQDFDGELSALLDLVLPDIESQVSEGIPHVRQMLGKERCAQLFHSAGRVSHRAPIHRDSSPT
jgi:hypothetical protein